MSRSRQQQHDTIHVKQETFDTVCEEEDRQVRRRDSSTQTVDSSPMTAQRPSWKKTIKAIESHHYKERVRVLFKVTWKGYTGISTYEPLEMVLEHKDALRCYLSSIGIRSRNSLILRFPCLVPFLKKN